MLLTLDAKAAMVKSRNVVAQTKTGDTHNVVVAGAHLATVAESPGINDNGTGVAALLETAAALGCAAEGHQRRAVRVLGVRGGGAGRFDEICREPGP